MKGDTRGCETGRGEGWGVGGRLSEVNAWAVSKGQDKLVGKFKMEVGDVISIRGQVLEHTCIPTGFGMEGDQKGFNL